MINQGASKPTDANKTEGEQKKVIRLDKGEQGKQNDQEKGDVFNRISKKRTTNERGDYQQH